MTGTRELGAPGALAHSALEPLRIRALPGVWRPHNDARLLARLVLEQGWAAGADALDVFTGSGVLAIGCARAGARSVTAIDVSRRALLTTALNARRNGVQIRTLRGNLFAPVAGKRFDLIVANPPYYPSPTTLPRTGIARAWAGGHEGRALIDAFCNRGPDFVRPGGRLLVVHGSFNGERATRELLEAGGLETEVALRHRGPLGPVGRASLGDGGQSLDPADDGAEETIVICGVRHRP